MSASTMTITYVQHTANTRTKYDPNHRNIEDTKSERKQLIIMKRREIQDALRIQSMHKPPKLTIVRGILVSFWILIRADIIQVITNSLPFYRLSIKCGRIPLLDRNDQKLAAMRCFVCRGRENKPNTLRK